MIDEKAIIREGAFLDQGVSVGAYAVIEEKVKLGKGVNILPFAHIKGDTEIAEGTFVGTGAIIGEIPQMLGISAKSGSASGGKENIGKVRIGKNNTIREYVTIHASTKPDKGTSLGDNNFLMGFSHIAHDCEVGNNVVICNGALIAGHCKVGNRAFISGNVVVHQFVKIGELSMIGGLSRVNQDVPPFMIVVGDSRVWGVNVVGLKRAKFSHTETEEVKKVFNILYREKLSLKSAIEKIKELNSMPARQIVDFINSSKRGLCGPKKSTLLEKIFLDYPYFLRTKIPTYQLFLKSKKI